MIRGMKQKSSVFPLTLVLLFCTIDILYYCDIINAGVKNMDNLFMSWFAGFADGEGYFGLEYNNGSNYPSFRPSFVIKVRGDEEKVINEIKAKTGLGRINKIKIPNGNEQIRFEITTLEDCKNLIKIFDKFPLRAKKARDYKIWRTAVLYMIDNGVKRNQYLMDLKVDLMAVKKFNSTNK